MVNGRVRLEGLGPFRATHWEKTEGGVGSYKWRRRRNRTKKQKKKAEEQREAKRKKENIEKEMARGFFFFEWRAGREGEWGGVLQGWELRGMRSGGLGAGCEGFGPFPCPRESSRGFDVVGQGPESLGCSENRLNRTRYLQFAQRGE